MINQFTALAAYAGSVLLANVLIERFGLVHVLWIGALLAPAGVYAAGLSLVLRDAVHELGGVLFAFLGIGLGVALSVMLADPRIAVASGVAFALSEVLDLAVYVPLRRRGWTVAALISSVVGLVVDSLVFLWLAFGSFALLAGQVAGKTLTVLVTVGVVALTLHRSATPEPAQ